MLVILSGVSGAGKDTIKKELIKRMENIETLPSYTSREMRNGDIAGETYNFVSREEFEKMIENKEFYEYDIIRYGYKWCYNCGQRVDFTLPRNRFN